MIRASIVVLMNGRIFIRLICAESKLYGGSVILDDRMATMTVDHDSITPPAPYKGHVEDCGNGEEDCCGLVGVPSETLEASVGSSCDGELLPVGLPRDSGINGVDWCRLIIVELQV